MLRNYTKNKNELSESNNIIENKNIGLLDQQIVTIKIFAILVATISAVILGVEFYLADSLGIEIIISRAISVIIPTVIFVLSTQKIGSKQIVILMYVLICTFVFSSSITLYYLPTFVEPSFYVSVIIIFTVGLSFGWKQINQIIIASIFLVLTSALLVLNPEVYNLIDNVFLTAVILILLLGLSIWGCSLIPIAREKSLDYKSEPKQTTVKEDTITEEDSSNLELLKNIPEAVFKTSVSGKFVYGNTELVKLLGYDNISALKKLNIKTDIYTDPLKREDFQKQIEKQRLLKNYKSEIKKKDGKILTVKINAKLLTDKNGKPAFYEGTIRDISKDIKLEQEKNNELEKLKKENEKATSETSSAIYTRNVKAQFLAKMTHEIRTPMNSVLGFLTLIENGLFESEDELKDFAHNAKISADSLLDIINNILDISKIEAGKMELYEEEFGIQEEIDKANSIITPSAKERSLLLSYNISEVVPKVVIGDSTRYRQVIVNLLSNSVKYTESGEINVNVDVVSKTEATLKIQTVISDTGIGIPEDKIPDLFKPYSQVKERKWIKENSIGTGLGLMICKEFVTLMGGEILLDSKIGVGTTVTFTSVFRIEKDFLSERVDIDLDDDVDDGIPDGIVPGEVKNLTDEVLTENKPEIQSEESIFSKVGRTKKSNKRLLLVEDNPISQSVELKLLREAGYNVDPVSNGYDAIEAVKSNTFNLVLMDIEMTEMDGIEATKKIRKLELPMGEIPVIAVTAHSSMKDREKCLAAGMDDYIAKPININFLKMTIDQWLQEEK